MAFDLASIACDSVRRPPRMLLLGIDKIGKTTFACGSYKPILIRIKGEDGADDIAVAKFPLCKTYSDVESCLNTLGTQQHDFGTIVIDSASSLEPLIWDAICQKYRVNCIEKADGGYGHGYTESLNYWRKITEYLDALREQKNMASIIIGHTRVKAFSSPDIGTYDTWQFSINEKAASVLMQWADVTIFAKMKTVVKTEEVGFNKEISRPLDAGGHARYLYTQKNPAYPSGGRGIYGRLPDELPLSWNAFMDAVGKAK